MVDETGDGEWDVPLIGAVVSLGQVVVSCAAAVGTPSPNRPQVHSTPVRRASFTVFLRASMVLTLW